MNISTFIEIDPNSIKVNYFRENIIDYNRYCINLHKFYHSSNKWIILWQN